MTQSDVAAFPVGTAMHWGARDAGPAGAGDGISVLYTGATCPATPAYEIGMTDGDIAIGATPPAP